MFDKLWGWLTYRQPKTSEVAFTPTLLTSQPANMAAQAAAASVATANAAHTPAYFSVPKDDIVKKLSDAELARQRAAEEERLRRNRRAEESSSGSYTPPIIDTWSSDNSSNWSPDTSSSGSSDFSGGGGSFGGGGSDGSW